MKSTKVLRSAVCFAIIWLAGSLLARSESPATREGGWVDWAGMIVNGDKAAQDAAVNRAIDERHAMTEGILNVLSRPVTASSRPQIAAAIKIAGIIRATEAIGPLLDQIDFVEVWPRPTTRPYIWEPSLELVPVTLVQIGGPVIDPAIDRLSKAQTQATQSLYAAVIKGVLGKECARYRVQLALDQARAAHADTAPFEYALTWINSDNP
jgi:hypothetical protein